MNQLQENYRIALRESAISKAKVEIALAGKRVSDYDYDQLEIIVKSQEDKLKEKYRNTAFVLLLLALGIT
jgi:chaperonin GroEL (HSP60 family)